MLEALERKSLDLQASTCPHRDDDDLAAALDLSDQCGGGIGGREHHLSERTARHGTARDDRSTLAARQCAVCMDSFMLPARRYAGTKGAIHVRSTAAMHRHGPRNGQDPTNDAERGESRTRAARAQALQQRLCTFFCESFKISSS